jgi:hypothetical protein
LILYYIYYRYQTPFCERIFSDIIMTSFVAFISSTRDLGTEH